jgi:polyisoprenoid-binding protein YceI
MGHRSGRQAGLYRHGEQQPGRRAICKWSGKINYDPQAPEAARVAITVNLASASTADQTRDTMLQGPEFFGASPAGKAVFTAKGFKPMGKDRFAANGTLAINGVNVPVRLLFDLTLAGDRAVAKAARTLTGWRCMWAPGNGAARTRSGQGWFCAST